MKCILQNHSFRTTSSGEFIEITDWVREVATKSGVDRGMALVYAPHTTCSIVINERERGFIRDFQEVLGSLVPQEVEYRHDDLSVRTENLEDDPHEIPNGHSHCRGALLSSSSEAIPIWDGELLLGRYQRIFFVELDRGRDRRVLIQAMGE